MELKYALEKLYVKLMPEDYDACWQDGSGIQCFSDVAIIPLHIHNTKEICEIINLEKL